MGLKENAQWYDVRARTHNNTPKGFRAKEDFTGSKAKAPEEETDAPLIAIGGMLGDEKGMSALKLSFRLGGSLAALTVLGTGAWQGYDNLVASEETIDSVPGGTSFDQYNQRVVPKEQQKPKPEVFDNGATTGKIGSNNILYVPREVLDKTPLADEKGNPIFDFPWDPHNPVEIKYEKSLGILNPRWKEVIEIDPNTEFKNSFQAKVTLPAGYEFTTLYPGRVFFAGFRYNKEASKKSPSNPYGVAVSDGPPQMAKIEFMAPNGVLYFINIGIRTDQGNVVLEPLIEAPLIGLENDQGTDWEKGMPVERGQKIFRINEEVKGILGMYIEGGINGDLRSPNGRIPGNFIFQAQKDPAGVEKLLVAEAK